MKIHCSFLLLAMSGLILSCSQAETADKTDRSAVSSNIGIDSLQVDSLQAENTTVKNQTIAKPIEGAREVKETLIDGVWMHEEDDKAYVAINGTSWVSGYEGIEVTEEDKYQITKVDKLPQFVDPKIDADFLILSNKSDTIYYELNGVTKETLCLTWYPAGRTHIYKRKLSGVN